MEYAHMNYNHEEIFRGLYVSMGNEINESNRHKEGKEETMNLVDTIKSI